MKERNDLKMEKSKKGKERKRERQKVRESGSRNIYYEGERKKKKREMEKKDGRKSGMSGTPILFFYQTNAWKIRWISVTKLSISVTNGGTAWK